MLNTPVKKSIPAFFMALLIGGCATIGYYGQSIGGQLEILARRKPIQELLDDPATDEALRDKLALVLRIREFASSEVSLPDNPSYRSYAELRRSYAIWNVFAAPEFELRLRKWCFPFAGCVQYRGYFSEQAAGAYAAGLRAEGLDVHVAGVAAYSTLGWFHDPLLNTALNRSPAELAGLIFHELAHQAVYVRDDTAFNESFATAVELEGARRWAESRGMPGEYHEYLQKQNRRAEFVSLVMRGRKQLVQLYATSLGADEMRAAKATIFDDLRGDYRQLKQEWDGYSAYDDWFARDLNNAHILAVGAYHRHLPAFQNMLRRYASDLSLFYSAVRALGRLPPEERRAACDAQAGVQAGGDRL